MNATELAHNAIEPNLLTTLPYVGGLPEPFAGMTIGDCVEALQKAIPSITEWNVRHALKRMERAGLTVRHRDPETRKDHWARTNRNPRRS